MEGEKRCYLVGSSGGGLWFPMVDGGSGGAGFKKCRRKKERVNKRRRVGWVWVMWFVFFFNLKMINNQKIK